MPDTVGVVDTVPSRRLPTSGQSAVFGLARDDAGDIGNRAGKECPGTSTCTSQATAAR